MYAEFTDLLAQIEKLYELGAIERIMPGRLVYECDLNNKIKPIEVTLENRKAVSMWRGITYMDTLEDAEDYIHNMSDPKYVRDVADKYGNPVYRIVDMYGMV